MLFKVVQAQIMREILQKKIHFGFSITQKPKIIEILMTPRFNIWNSSYISSEIYFQ